MEIQINGVFSVMPLHVRYTHNSITHDAVIYYNLEEGRLIHNLDIPSEAKLDFDNKIIELFGPLSPNPENMPQLQDYVTSDLQEKISAARRGDTSAFDTGFNVHTFDHEEEEEK